MFAAIVASLLFTFVVATLAAKSRKAELVIMPALDILQSVPVLGFLTFTVVFFMGLFPGSELGAECAAIFAIFTSQAWNMAFSFYQSLRTVPRDLDEVSRHFRLSPWLRFWRLEVPFAAPGLIWNTMMSMSGGWFFVVASEAITVGDTTVKLPGIGSWLARRHRRSRTSRAVVLAVADHGGGDPGLRPAAVPADRGLGRQVPLRADGRAAAPALLGLRPVAARHGWCAGSRRPSAGWPRLISTAAARASRAPARGRLRASAARQARPIVCGWRVVLAVVGLRAVVDVVTMSRAHRSACDDVLDGGRARACSPCCGSSC